MSESNCRAPARKPSASRSGRTRPPVVDEHWARLEQVTAGTGGRSSRRAIRATPPSTCRQPRTASQGSAKGTYRRATPWVRTRPVPSRPRARRIRRRSRRRTPRAAHATATGAAAASRRPSTSVRAGRTRPRAPWWPRRRRARRAVGAPACSVGRCSGARSRAGRGSDAVILAKGRPDGSPCVNNQRTTGRGSPCHPPGRPPRPARLLRNGRGPAASATGPRDLHCVVWLVLPVGDRETDRPRRRCSRSPRSCRVPRRALPLRRRIGVVADRRGSDRGGDHRTRPRGSRGRARPVPACCVR
jgi:hypothetical protein